MRHCSIQSKKLRNRWKQTIKLISHEAHIMGKQLSPGPHGSSFVATSSKVTIYSRLVFIVRLQSILLDSIRLCFATHWLGREAGARTKWSLWTWLTRHCNSFKTNSRKRAYGPYATVCWIDR